MVLPATTREVSAVRKPNAVPVPDAAALPDAAAARFATIYRQTHAQVLGFISRRLIPRDFARAEELTHDTYLVAWRRFADLPQTVPEARAWLFTTARHLLLKSNAINRRGDLGVRISDDALGVIPASSDSIQTRGLQMDLMSAWSQLTAAEQEIISLTYWDELSSAEAGRVLGITDRAYRQKLHRARTKLKTILEQ